MAMECFTGVHNEESGLHYMFEQIDNTRGRETRSTHTHQVKIDNIRTVTGRKAFGFRGPNFWNKLETDARLITEKVAFKNHILKLFCCDVNPPG